ncbi:DinB family protein [Pararhizobium mangrovi]|uniref:Damage-inducible protein DinB n=1 Tax=Pararhizobium mangrovi TaxID=2590452 RepID=A0A506UC89_9HYPH|nr:DinB family protein [Pararhizobium mangrovi]TPW32052.1 damage-inducible protein DinB [Pararhizobium mangrovi]
MKDHFRMMAAYNEWANRRVYDAAAALPDEAYRRDVGAFFGSLNGTLNHILVADRIWMHRFTGGGENPSRLDAIVADRLAELRAARESEDARIVAFVEGMEPEEFAGRFTYITVTDTRRISQRLAPALTHFFNHQTHHRGQTHCILSMLESEPPSLDLSAFHRQPAGRAFA